MKEAFAMRNHYVIGDVHGCYDDFIALLKKIEEKDKDAQIILVGDLIDRGPKSQEMLLWAMENITVNGWYKYEEPEESEVQKKSNLWERNYWEHILAKKLYPYTLVERFLPFVEAENSVNEKDRMTQETMYEYANILAYEYEQQYIQQI